MSVHNRYRLDGARARPYRFTPLPVEGEATTGQGDSWQGYQEGFDQGFTEGQQQGQQKGYDEGLAQGLEAGRQQGFASGRQEGLTQASAEARDELEQALVPVKALKGVLEEGYQTQVRQQRDLILELVQRVAQQVIRCELTLQPQQVLSLVEETLRALPDGQEGVKIHLEPAAVERLKELAPERIQDWTLVADPGISPGGCRVVSENLDADGSAEARLETCMNQVQARLEAMDLAEQAEAAGAPEHGDH
ncbi:flagellar assembly protein H [Ferrimonas balearica]|uniref:flagellar assembly protein FliH n=1 Tax=Ferrimonas balearica TaxID=44012 RepID=UPI001C59B281|nr:flagellar assembly protein FliH [Ferrimonas balearica]MBW3139426.1 flagellar assembly protein H [Ferrimonas balearica]MBY6106494.1 flagellar assembly protein H [Ferrimonas balearica]